MERIISQINDREGTGQGCKTVDVVFDYWGPEILKYEGARYVWTGRQGSNRLTGLKLIEMAAINKPSLWVTEDAKSIWLTN